MSRIEDILEKATRLRNGDALPEGAINIPLQPVAPEVFKIEQKLIVENPYLVTVTDSGSPIAEEYKKLKSLILKLTNAGGFKNTLMVTSTMGGEGKSITATNLAITLAQEYDHTVLLVDADLRKPSISGYLGIQPQIGLTDCLTKGVDVSDALIKTGIGKLVILPAGSRIENPVELFSSNRMQTFINELKQRYPDRYVIFDTPPVLSFADAHSLGLVVDGVIFVVKEGGAALNNVKDALNILKDTNVLGVVFNNVELSRFDSHYSYYTYNTNYYYSVRK
ncbi:MAG: polysaccharide biosynthesis [Geobacteraceae bacterium]|nr:MAG: polysaccharide biosynthesis [Geobacteraceae bacterium]